MNKVILMGRLTRDPEVRYSAGESGTAIARYTLAVDRRFKRDGEATADFISCVSFGRTAEFAEKYFRQGLKIIVSGRIQTGSYTNRDGQKVYTTEVVVEEQEFAEGKNSSQQGAGQQPPQNYGGQQNAPQQSVPQQNTTQQSQPQGYGQQGGYNVPQQSAPTVPAAGLRTAECTTAEYHTAVPAAGLWTAGRIQCATAECTKVPAAGLRTAECTTAECSAAELWRRIIRNGRRWFHEHSGRS